MSSPKFARRRSLVVLIASGLLTVACGHATRSAPPQPPHGTAQLTAAQVKGRFQRVLVAEHGIVAMVGREGCVATVSAGTDDTGDFEEMRVRCPRAERLAA